MNRWYHKHWSDWLQLNYRGLVPNRQGFLSLLPERPDRFWGPPSFLSNLYWWWEGWGAVCSSMGRTMKLKIRICQMPKSTVSGVYLYAPYTFQWYGAHRGNFIIPSFFFQFSDNELINAWLGDLWMNRRISPITLIRHMQIKMGSHS
jgi:hypothetical protein